MTRATPMVVSPTPSSPRRRSLAAGPFAPRDPSRRHRPEIAPPSADAGLRHPATGSRTVDVVPAEPCGSVDDVVAPDPGGADPSVVLERRQGTKEQRWIPALRAARSRSPTTTGERPSSKWAAGSAATRSAADPSSTHTRSTPSSTGGTRPRSSPGPSAWSDGQYRFNDENQLPAGTEPVDDTAYDFRESRLLGVTTLDFAFTDLVRDADGRSRLGRTDRRTGEVCAENGYRGTELYAGRPWPHLVITRRATQVGAVTVATRRSYLTTRDLTGFCGSADGAHISEQGAVADGQTTLSMGKATRHYPGAAHLVVSGTCSPPREATSADQLPLAMVGQ